MLTFPPLGSKDRFLHSRLIDHGASRNLGVGADSMDSEQGSEDDRSGGDVAGVIELAEL